MKNLIKLSILLLVGFFFGCSEDDSNSTDPLVVNPVNVQSTVVTSTWRITKFMDGAVNETSNYTGYNFTFLSNGTATAVKAAQTTNGTWSTFTDSGRVKWVLNFGNTSPLDELNEDWKVLTITATKIELNDTSSDGSVDLLTFERN